MPTKRDAQKLIDECDTFESTPRSFRKEMIAQGLINDVKKIFEEKDERD
jgi:hypothetical protein